MKDKFVTIQDAAVFCKMPVRTCYRLARDLKLTTVMYGRHLVPAESLPVMAANRRGIGNPTWKKGSKAASRDGKRGGVASHERKPDHATPSRRVAKGSR